MLAAKPHIGWRPVIKAIPDLTVLNTAKKFGSRVEHYEAPLRIPVVLLPVHIAAGGLAIILGGIALVASKGATVHRRSGLLFVYAMLTMGISGSILALRQSLTNVNALGGFMSAYFVVTALTTVRPVSAWGSIFGDPIIATAILDRLLHHSTTINIRGESYRLKDRRKAGLFPRPEEDSGRSAPFLSTDILQNGPRRQGSASPRKTSAPVTAPGRSTDSNSQ